MAIWLRVRLGGERMTEVAEDYGYRDGSGVHRVLQRLEEKAQHDRSLSRHLKKLAEQVSRVDPHSPHSGTSTASRDLPEPDLLRPLEVVTITLGHR